MKIIKKTKILPELRIPHHYHNKIFLGYVVQYNSGFVFNTNTKRTNKKKSVTYRMANARDVP